MRNFLRKIEQLLGIYRWHPTIALRYLPIVAEIRRIGTRQSSVLEVGSGSLGIAPYLRRPVTGVDIEFSPPHCAWLKRVVADAERLPFADSNFDFVLLVDVLEHIPKQNRQKVVVEAARVARQELIIAVPTGSASQRHDEELADNFIQKYKTEFPFLKEHLTHGLPTVKEVQMYIQTAADKKGCTPAIQTQNNMSLWLRRFLMWGWMNRGILVNIFFRKVLLGAIPVMRHINFEPTYRTLFFCRLNN